MLTTVSDFSHHRNKQVSAYAAEPEAPAEVAPLEPAPSSGAGTRRYLRIGAAAAVCIGLFAAAFLLVPQMRRTGLETFWAPVLSSPGPILVCVGQPKAYQFMTSTQAALDRWFAAAPDGRVPPEDLQRVPLTEFVPVWERYISITDAETFGRLSKLLSSFGKQTIVRGGRSVSLSDLRGRPVVLVGAYNNDWTLTLAGELRYYFDFEPGRGEVVRDRRHPEKLDWLVPNSWPHRRIAADYAVVTRVRNATTEQVVVIAGGITHFGTQAAGEFLTNAAYLDQALRQAPRDWPRRNLQVVLSVKVVSGTAGPPVVRAVHYW